MRLSYNIMWIALGMLLLVTAANGQDRHRNHVTVCQNEGQTHEISVNINQVWKYMKFPDRGGRCKPLASKGLAGHFPTPTMTGTSATVIFMSGAATVNGVPVSEGDEIAAVTGDGLVAGVVVIEDVTANHAMAVWVDDNLTPEVDGFDHSEDMRFFVWSNVGLMELDDSYITSYMLDDSCVLCQDDLKYNTNQVYVFNQIDWTETLGIVIEDSPFTNLPVPVSIAIDGVYPNPFKESFTMDVRVPRQLQGVATVYNTIGQVVMSIPVEFSNGANRLRADLPGIPAGLYVVNIQAENLSTTTTIVKQ